MFFQNPRQREQQSVSAIDVQGAIEMVRELDGFASVAAVSGQRGQRDRVRAQSDGVIGGDGTLIVQAEAAGQIEAAGQAAEVAGGIGGGTGEALVVIGAKAGEHGVGLLQSHGLGEAEFADQTVLAGAPGALDAALGLGRVGGDLGDAELFQSASQLRGGLFSGELLGETPVRIVALEDGVTVAVEAEGRPCARIMACRARR